MFRFIMALALTSAIISCRSESSADYQIKANNQDPLFYVGTYTQKLGNVHGKASGIYICRLNMQTGRISKVGESSETINPSFSDISNNGLFLYSVNETAKGTLSTFKIVDGGKGLEFVNTVSSYGDYPCYVHAEKNGNFLFTANYATGSVAVYSLKNGVPEKVVLVDVHKGKGPDSRQESAHAHSFISPDSKFAYACDLGTDQIYVYKMDADSVENISKSSTYSTSAGAGPRHLTFHPALNTAYVLNELNGTIECMERDTIKGSLRNIQTIGTNNGQPDKKAGSAEICITPSGKFLYASNRGNLNNIAIYEIDQNTGKLKFTEMQPVYGKTPRNFAIDPTGTFLLVANQDSDNIVTFRIDTETGKLIETGNSIDIHTPVCIRFWNSNTAR